MLNYRIIDSADSPLLPLIRELQQEYWRELDVDICFQDFATELETLPGQYKPPRGRLFIVYEGEEAIGCGGLRPLSDTDCELKRIYVRPAHRGKKVGKEISLKLIEEARAIGYSRMLLDTLDKLVTAQLMYEGLGFTRREPYNDSGDQEVVVYFEKNIT